MPGVHCRCFIYLHLRAYCTDRSAIGVLGAVASIMCDGSASGGGFLYSLERAADISPWLLLAVALGYVVLIVATLTVTNCVLVPTPAAARIHWVHTIKANAGRAKSLTSPVATQCSSTVALMSDSTAAFRTSTGLDSLSPSPTTAAPSPVDARPAGAKCVASQTVIPGDLLHVKPAAKLPTPLIQQPRSGLIPSPLFAPTKANFLAIPPISLDAQPVSPESSAHCIVSVDRDGETDQQTSVRGALSPYPSPKGRAIPQPSDSPAPQTTIDCDAASLQQKSTVLRPAEVAFCVECQRSANDLKRHRRALNGSSRRIVPVVGDSEVAAQPARLSSSTATMQSGDTTYNMIEVLTPGSACAACRFQPSNMTPFVQNGSMVLGTLLALFLRWHTTPAVAPRAYPITPWIILAFAFQVGLLGTVQCVQLSIFLLRITLRRRSSGFFMCTCARASTSRAAFGMCLFFRSSLRLLGLDINAA